MAALIRLQDFDKWLDTSSIDNRASVTIRAALRGLPPLFDENAELRSNVFFFRSINLALVHLICTDTRPRTMELLAKFRDPGAVTEASFSVKRLNHYEGASARRRSRASSSDESFSDGVLRRSASKTITKLTLSKTKSRTAVAQAVSTLMSDVFSTDEACSGAVGLLNRVLSSAERRAFWEAVSHDCEFLDSQKSVRDLFSTPLYLSEKFADVDLIGPEKSNNFWRYWYSGFRSGKPLDWKILEEVALSEESIDADGTSGIDQKIAEIELRNLRLLAYRPERVERDSETGLYTLLPDTIKDAQRYQNAIRKIHEDIDRIKSNNSSFGANTYTALYDVIDILDNSINIHRDNPMFVHDDFVKCLKMILRKIDRQDLPPHDDAIENLIDDLNTGSIDIRATDEGVAKAVASRMRIKTRPPNPYEARSLANEIEIRSAQSDLRLAAQLRADCDIIQSLDKDGRHESDPEPEQAVHRVANRLPQMQNPIDEKSPLDKTVDAAAKATKLQKGAEAVGNASERAWTWLQYLLSQF